MSTSCLDNTKEYIKKATDIDLIFITGKIGSGKDTAADYLQNKFNFKKLRYGDIIKEILTSNGWDGKKDIKGRQLMLDVGAAFRKWDENIFVKQMVCLTINSIANEYNNPTKISSKFNKKRIVISDVRLLNEIVYYLELLEKEVRSIKYVSIKMLGSNYNNCREIDEVIINDPTEISLDGYETDYFILNDQFTKLESIYENLDLIIKTEFGYQKCIY